MTVVLAVSGWLSGLASVEYLAGTASTLILLGAGILVYRAFRQRYLLYWIIGWSLYFLYRLSLDRAQDLGFPPALLALTYIAFCFAAALFSGAVFEYLRLENWAAPLITLGLGGALMAVVRAYWAPNATGLAVAYQILYRLGAVAAAFQFGIFSRGRKQLSLWLMSAMLVLVHIDYDITRPHIDTGFDVLVESLL